MNPQTHRNLRTGALVSVVIGLTLLIARAVPAAVDQRLDQLEATAAPNVAALAERKAADEAKTAPEAPSPLRTQNLASGRVIKNARITAYHATEVETDSSPCQGAMSGVDFCHPPFPIVANNCLKLGTKVEIEGETYIVADRMASRFGCSTFDVLNGDGLPDYADVFIN